MRLIAWNCNERFNRKYLHLRDLEFDVAVVTECGPFEPELTETRAVSSVLKLAVDQPGHTKHIGVLAQDPWHVEPLPLVPSQPWVLPVKVTGPVDFTVLAIWALGPNWVEGHLSYAAQTARVVAEVLPSVVGPVVLAGDLNAPISSVSADARRHADTVSQLAALEFVSAFTAARGEADPLTEPTLYHQRKLEQPFHIDHVFVPKDWASGIEVTVGTYQDWVAAKRSDHVPIIVDIPTPDLLTSTVVAAS
jgi:exodeoxyribonuclease-3